MASAYKPIPTQTISGIIPSPINLDVFCKMINVSFNYQAIPLSPTTLYQEQFDNLKRLQQVGIIKTVASASNYSKSFNNKKLFEIVYSSNKNNFILILNTNLMTVNCENNFKTIYEFINKDLTVIPGAADVAQLHASAASVAPDVPYAQLTPLKGGRVKKHHIRHKKSRCTHRVKKSRRNTKRHRK